MATVNQMVKEAYALVGQPYLWGGNGETLEYIIRRYAEAKEQSKSATDDMIHFLKSLIPIDLTTIHFQDCSGMVVEIFRKLNCVSKDFDDTADGLYRRCRKIDHAMEGALCFYYDGKKCNHVGICVNQATVIHCLSTKTGVIVEPIQKRADKWVKFGLPDFCIDFTYDTITLQEDVWVYRTARESKEKLETSSKILYKKGDYFIFKTYQDCTNITKNKDVAGGWIYNYDLRKAEEW